MSNKERMMYLTTTDNPYNPLIMYEEICMGLSFSAKITAHIVKGRSEMRM